MTCALARNTTALRIESAVSTSVSTRAAAPSETSEQSVRLSGPGDPRVLVRQGAAELEAQVLAQLGQRVGDAVPVVLGGDRGERIGLIAMALEVELGDLAEHAGKAALDPALLLEVGRP